MSKALQYWLVKSEPESYSIDALKTDKETWWTGVRNFQARNFMQEMKKGDLVLFYHSNTEPGVYGVAKVVKVAAPDETQFDKKSDYFEPRATREKPVWYCPRIKFVNKFKKPVLLGEIRIDPKLSSMQILEKGSRLSVTPVSEKEFKRINKLSA